MGNSVRKILVVLFLLLFVCGLYAQKDSSKRYDFKRGSEVGISYGYNNLLRDRYTSNNLWYNLVNTFGGESLSFSDYFENKDELRGPTYISGAINLGYTYRHLRWLEFSGRFIYSGRYTNYYDSSIEDKLLYRQNVHAMGLLGVVRFVWLNRKYVRLYSSIGLGFSTVIETGNDRTNAYVLPAADITFFGIKAGKTIYGFAELSAGESGYLSLGVGFNISEWMD